MAANPDVIPADAVDHELEAMRKDDYSWHPCQVHFSPNCGGLVIKYGNNGSQDILVSEKEALMRIRVRSLPLQPDDCTHIKPGEHVVVNRDAQSETGFFDAEVEKVLPVRHSKRMNCRCTFMIRWLHQDLNDGSLKVPSSSIMRLAKKSINNHPTISAFIDAVAVGNSSFSTQSPQMNIVSDFDLDLHNLLEKQIEGIRNSVHGPKRIRDEILGLEVNTDEQVKEREISMPNVREPEVNISTETSQLRRSHRSREALLRADIKTPTPPGIPSPSIKEELPENKSPLNPLAARAALASLMSMLPKTIKISHDDEEGKAFKSLNLAGYSSPGIDDISAVDKSSSKTEAVLKPVRIVKKSLFSTNGSSDTSQVLEVSSTALVNQGRKGHDKVKGSDFGTNVKQPRQDKMNPEIGTRLTRAKVQKAEGVPDNDISNGSKSSTMTNRRITRSVLCKDEERLTIDTSSEHKIMASKDKKKLFTTPSPVAEVDLVSSARIDTVSKTEEGNKGINIKEKTNNLDTKGSGNMRRLTRSMINKEAANTKTETVKESGSDGFPGDQASKLSRERNKKRNTSDVAIVTHDSEGNIPSDGGRRRYGSKNSLDLKKQKVRSSPRFLPKT